MRFSLGVFLLGFGSFVFAESVFTNRIVAHNGTVSQDQPISVLSVRDQSGEQDDWNKYRDFQPNSTGLSASFYFKIPDSTSLTKLDVNYRGWEKAKQVWKFHIYNYTTSSWVLLGDNANAGSWIWTLLSYSLPGKFSDYLSSTREIRVRYQTTSRLENSLIDYIALTGQASQPPPPPPPDGGGSTSGRAPAGTLYGLTLDSVDNLSAIYTSLSKLSKFPTTRIVFDEYVPATDYRPAVDKIYPVSFIMGEILDSYYVKRYSVSAYLDRSREYMDALGDKVDIWEVGNEINGEWLGSTADVVQKMKGAYDLAKARNAVTELTLYYNDDCWENPANEMFTWTERNVPQSMKDGLNYVLISYYEDDCNGLQPDWQPVFERLGQMFPNSKIGFGEVGTTVSQQKEAYIRRYYSMQISHARYIGGYFWWYGRQDFVPYTNYLWSVFNDVIKSH